jgi:hypothetical protein
MHCGNPAEIGVSADIDVNDCTMFSGQFRSAQ